MFSSRAPAWMPLRSRSVLARSRRCCTSSCSAVGSIPGSVVVSTAASVCTSAACWFWFSRSSAVGSTTPSVCCTPVSLPVSTSVSVLVEKLLMACFTASRRCLWFMLSVRFSPAWAVRVLTALTFSRMLRAVPFRTLPRSSSSWRARCSSSAPCCSASMARMLARYRLPSW